MTYYGLLKLLNKYKYKNTFIGIQSDESIKKTKKNFPCLNGKERPESINLGFNNIILYDNIDQTQVFKNDKIDIFVISEEFKNCDDHISTLNY